MRQVNIQRRWKSSASKMFVSGNDDSTDPSLTGFVRGRNQPNQRSNSSYMFRASLDRLIACHENRQRKRRLSIIGPQTSQDRLLKPTRLIRPDTRSQFLITKVADYNQR